jgi:hypothetical protein
MSGPPEISSLAAAAAALWPERASVLLARCPDPAAAARAGALASRPRAARLAALATAFSPRRPSDEVIRAVAAEERPRLAAVVAAVGRAGAPASARGQAPGVRDRQPVHVAPLLARLAWERVTSIQADRDGARATVAR